MSFTRPVSFSQVRLTSERPSMSRKFLLTAVLRAKKSRDGHSRFGQLRVFGG